MLRLKFAIALTVLVGVLIFGATAAHGLWWWNSQIDVEGTVVRTIWTVVDDQTEQPIDHEMDNFHARIKVKLPKKARVEILKSVKYETVILKKSKNLECKSDGIEAKFIYRVSSLGHVDANKVVVTLMTAGGEYIGSATGHIGENIKLQVLIPADQPSCAGYHSASGDQDDDDDDEDD